MSDLQEQTASTDQTSDPAAAAAARTSNSSSPKKSLNPKSSNPMPDSFRSELSSSAHEKEELEGEEEEEEEDDDVEEKVGKQILKNHNQTKNLRFDSEDDLKNIREFEKTEKVNKKIIFDLSPNIKWVS
jgi:hypothetical protein